MSSDTKSDRTTQANRIVNRYAIGNVLPGVIPVPLLDVAIIAGVQLKMLHSLAKHYETPFSKQLAKSAIASLVGSAYTGSLAVASRNLFRAVPGVGTLAGMATMTTLGGTSTYAIGKIFIQHFESGGTFLTFDPEKVKDHYTSYSHASPVSSAGKKP